MSQRFQISSTPLPGLHVMERQPRGDRRGFLERMLCTEELAPWLGDRSIRQINHTLTATQGTVRGLHFQKAPHAEMKFVSCLRGEVFDVAVDVRPESRTYLQWHAEVLSPDNFRTFLIPEGFAHGFQTLTPDCEMLYFHTAAYAPAAEAGLHPLDPALAIRWPLPVSTLSDRDAAHPLLNS